jgi:lysine/ornithine N-monooxygenase
LSKVPVAIIGAGPYGLSLAAHLAAQKIAHRIFGRPMQFWSQVAATGGLRYLKSYCFGTNLSSPTPGFSFADYSQPRGLETFEPCSISDFADYGHWFQQNNVPWVEQIDAIRVERQTDGFSVTLADGERLSAASLVVATGLSCFARVPSALASLSPNLAIHTSQVDVFSSYRGLRIAVIGAGQSALEAAALLNEAGAEPQLLVRGHAITWHHRVLQNRTLWRKLRSPITGLGSGPKAWALTRFPGAVHRAPAPWRTRFVATHLSAAGAWWLRERIESLVPVNFGTTVVAAREEPGGLILKLRHSNGDGERELKVDRVIAGSGYVVDVNRLDFLDPKLRSEIRRLGSAAKLDHHFQSSVPGLHFIGPASAMSFGPLFRFVVGAEYSARVVTARIRRIKRPGRGLQGALLG